MSIESDRIAELEAKLRTQQTHLDAASHDAHLQRDYIFALRRRIDELATLLEGERKANATLRNGIDVALTRLRAIEAAEAALFGP